MSEKVMTLHPEGKQGVNIDRAKYDQFSAAIENTLREQDGLTFTQLNAAIHDRLGDSFDGSISWYVTTVKLDLEARGVIVREGSSPQKVYLKRTAQDA